MVVQICETALHNHVVLGRILVHEAEGPVGGEYPFGYSVLSLYPTEVESRALRAIITVHDDDVK